MKYLLFISGLFLSAQASRASVLYSFTTQPSGDPSAFTFSFDESTFLTKTTIIPMSGLDNVSGLPEGLTLNSIIIAYLGPVVVVTENLNKTTPVVYFFDNGPWNTTGTYNGLLNVSQMTISDPGPSVPEPAEFGLAFIGVAGLLVMKFLRRDANSSQKSRS